MCLKMDWFEKVGPQNKEFFLAFVCFFLFDGCVSAHGVEVCSGTAISGVIFS